MNKQQIRKQMISRLCNNVRGHSISPLLDSMSDAEKKQELDVVKEFIDYISKYDENKDKLSNYGDDGR